MFLKLFENIRYFSKANAEILEFLPLILFMFQKPLTILLILILII